MRWESANYAKRSRFTHAQALSWAVRSSPHQSVALFTGSNRFLNGLLAGDYENLVMKISKTPLNFISVIVWNLNHINTVLFTVFINIIFPCDV